MPRISIDISEDVLQALKVPAGEIDSRLRRELAVRLYEKGLLTFGKARQLSGLSRWTFHDLLGDEGITRRYDANDLREDLRSLRELE